MSVIDQVNAIALKVGQDAAREYISEMMRESPLLWEIKERRIAIEYGDMEISLFPTCEGPPFPDFHRFTVRQSVRIHRFTGEISHK